MEEFLIKPIAKIFNAYTSKFAIPRQSGIAENIKSEIVFEPEYRFDEALRGIEEFSHLWLIWGFSQNLNIKWSPTVRPPRLGGNKRMGVFATRSPFRPNNLGLSCVRLCEVKKAEKKGKVLIVSGADIMNGSPIYDIKPYLSYTDSYPDSDSGFTKNIIHKELKVEIPESIRCGLDDEFLKNLESILKENPIPSYHSDTDRVYGFSFFEKEIKFKVNDGILSVIKIDSAN